MIVVALFLKLVGLMAIVALSFAALVGLLVIVCIVLFFISLFVSELPPPDFPNDN